MNEYPILLENIELETSDIMIELSDLNCENNVITAAEVCFEGNSAVATTANILSKIIDTTLKIIEWIFKWINTIWRQLKKIWNMTIGRNKDAKFSRRDLELPVGRILQGSENPFRLKNLPKIVSIDNLKTLKNSISSYEDIEELDVSSYIGNCDEKDVVDGLMDCNMYFSLCDNLVRTIEVCQKNAKADLKTFKKDKDKIKLIQKCVSNSQGLIKLINDTNVAMLNIERKVYGVNKPHSNVL